jgi:TolA-binding protein
MRRILMMGLAISMLAAASGCDVGGQSETSSLLRRQIEELRKENAALLNSLKTQAKLLEEARLEMDRLREDVAALKAAPKKREEAKTSLVADGDEEELEELLERATRVARDVAPYEGARLLAKLAKDYPFHEVGMRASAKLREWGVKPAEVTEERAGEIDAAVKKLIENDRGRWENLERARQLAGIGRYADAVKKLQGMVKEYPDTRQGREAKKTLFMWGVEGMDIASLKDDELKNTVGPAVQAHRLLGQGWHQLERDNLDKAKEIFGTIIEKYSETIMAEHARNGLLEIEERMGERRHGGERERDEEEAEDDGEGEDEVEDDDD